MPKHVLTFKHLLHTPLTSRRSDDRESKSVNDLIASSRILRPIARDVPPHVSAGERVWTPPVASASGSALGLIDVEEGGIHPAELLRRYRISQRQASRSAAGPAPPPSWCLSSETTSQTSAAVSTATKDLPIQPVSTHQLRQSSSLFSTLTSPEHRSRLVDFCFKVVLRHLEDEQLVYFSSGDANDEEMGHDEQYTMGGVLREQVMYLEPHLKYSLLEVASLLPETHPHRLTDRSLPSILSDPPPDIGDNSQFGDHIAPSSSTDYVEWDNPSFSTSTTLIHLPLTLHASPHSLLRQLPSASSLTSINLAYSTLPSDLDKLVSVLPPGLRELGLAGVRIGTHRGAIVSEETLRRGFSALGRKLIVLRMLDLSFARFDLTPKILTSLLHPASTHLPSLRSLGMRGYLKSRGSRTGDDGSTDIIEVDRVDSVGGAKRDEARKSVMDIVRGGGRKRYVEVVW
ncbi:hypothetical protein IAR55_004291 [Kwoniella newhampshirensis]|uniref:Uncharacterized protein n=1 Tax=Kwoniella newhampshirensis TaxID=1651941 RepID=A0AAW0YKI7_9TREE